MPWYTCYDTYVMIHVHHINMIAEERENMKPHVGKHETLIK